ncbi:MAG TPA: 3-keto-5-aminohexanoate cleavage protein [Anaerolineae bacterium]|nr:3-keto-5-aminohexanoate cleavage protein [Anaerolineae bacterium]HRV92011.1 3-keto-5-aminohexanoate cleavage protein [Anaerolineae bacterium]
MDKVIITAAVTGSAPTKEMSPAVPYSPEEIAQAAIDCWRAGAAIAHIHVRDPQTGAPEFRLDLFREVLERIRAESDMVVNLTTSGLHLSGSEAEIIEQRLEPVSLRPEICSLDVGSVNFRDRVFLNSPNWAETAARQMQAAGVKPEIEVFEVGHIDQALDLIKKGLIDEPPWFQLCMGIKWGIAAMPENLLFMKSKLPSQARWSVLGVGKQQLPMIALGILLGGNIRVGVEDNLYLSPGVLAQSNAEMVAQAVNLVKHLQREVATPADAREILGLIR